MIIDFYVPFFREKIHKSSIHNTKSKFISFVSENGYKNFEFLMIMDFYAPFFKKKVYKSSMYNIK